MRSALVAALALGLFVTAGFRDGRYIFGLASARGEWAPGSSKPGYDADATSKQCKTSPRFSRSRVGSRGFASTLSKPGFNPGTGLGRQANVAVRFLAKYVLSPLAPFIKYWSTPKRAARVITGVLTDESYRTGVHYDEKRQTDGRLSPSARP